MALRADKLRKIIHVDQDCFYAAVEERDDPQLKNKPLAVGGLGPRGVLTTANYVAREYGVRSAMPTQTALKLCPDLIIVPPHFDKYKFESERIRKIFLEYSEVIEPLSLDEAYIDVSECTLQGGIATKMAQEIREKIFTTTGLTASAGIAPNKFLAKVASDWNKPNGQFTIAPAHVAAFVKKLPVEKIPGVGKVTAKKMQNLNLRTCLDLQRLSIEELQSYFGSWGVSLYDICRGVDRRSVGLKGERKSLSVEHTFVQDLQTQEEIEKQVRVIYSELQKRIARAKIAGKIKHLIVKVKFHDHTQTTLARAEKIEVNLADYLALVNEAASRQAKAIRLIGLGVKLKAEDKKRRGPQLSLF